MAVTCISKTSKAHGGNASYDVPFGGKGQEVIFIKSSKKEIKRYECIKECVFDEYDDDGFPIDGSYKIVPVGSIWQESESMLAGGPDNVHLEREDCEGWYEWCEPVKETLETCFKQIASKFE